MDYQREVLDARACLIQCSRCPQDFVTPDALPATGRLIVDVLPWMGQSTRSFHFPLQVYSSNPLPILRPLINAPVEAIACE